MFCKPSQNSEKSFKKYFKLIFRGEERGNERNIYVRANYGSAASYTPPTRDRAGNLGMHPDRESNCNLYGTQANTQPIEPPWPGPEKFLSKQNDCKRNILGFKQQKFLSKIIR